MENIFGPFAGIAGRAFHAFAESLAWLVVVIAAAIPWILLFLFLSWLALKFLKWWVRKKREAKAKKSTDPNLKPQQTE